MVGSGLNLAESMGSQHQDHFRELEKGETGREVYALPTLVRVSHEVKTISLTRKMPETCRRRLIT